MHEGNDQMKIGFIGLGNMGTPIVKHLIRAGNELWVYDLQAHAVANLVKEGAFAANTVAEIARKCEVIFTMLQTGDQVQSVCLGVDGIFENAMSGMLYIDCSSIDISTARSLHCEAVQRAIAMIDAPVSGGVMGAENKTLTIMVGGEEAIFRRAEPILSEIGKNIIHAGSAGNGQAAKICNNMLLGISMIGVSEAFNLAEKLGLSAEKLFAISSMSSGQCWAMTSYAPVAGLVPSAPSNRGFTPGFAAKMMLKDLRLAQEAAADVGASTPLGAQAAAIYSLYCNDGGSEMDFSGVINFLKS